MRKSAWRAAAGGALASALIALMFAASPSPAAARSSAPPRFFGVVPQGGVSGADWSRLARVGLNLRLFVNWSDLEPRRGEFDFAALDGTMAAAAASGVTVMPTLGASPAWATPEAWRPPLAASSLAGWRGFLRALVLRYGPGGSFWRGRSERAPVHDWQVWNEPNYPIFWRSGPSASAYVRLLKASARTIRRADPKATVVAAGLAPIAGQPPPWEFLAQMYEIPGAREAFDAVALHPYTNTVAKVETEIELTRQAMRQAGDAGTPLLITELGLASAGDDNPYNLGPQGQARFLAGAFRRLAAKRRLWHLGGVYWFSLGDGSSADPQCPFCEDSGLFDHSGDPKPAWFALKRVVKAARR